MKNEIVTAEVVDVVELDETMLDLVVGGALGTVEANWKCSSNTGCNLVAGCGGGGGVIQA